MKSFLLKSVLVLVLISFTSCSSDDDTTDNSAEVNQVVGEWQMYRTENLEAVIDQWTGTEWTYVDQWFKNVWEDSEILIHLIMMVHLQSFMQLLKLLTELGKN